MASTGASGGARASAARWSGLETDEMKLLNCSLLFPCDARYEAFVTDLRPEVPPRPRPVDLSDSYSSPLLHFPSWGVVQFQVESASSSVMPQVCTIAGQCRFTRDDQEQFRNHMLSSRERRNLGRQPSSSMDWPDVRALQTCPVCGVMQKPGKEYWMIHHPLAQMHKTSCSASPVMSTRIICRMTCLPCLALILRGIDTVKVDDYHCCEGPVLQTLNHAPTFPVFQRDGTIVNLEKTNAWTLYVRLWEDSGLWQALEIRNNKIVMELIGSQLPVYQRTKPGVLPENSDKKCLACRKENSPNACSRCKRAVYCSKDCQKADWKRHKIADCLPAE